MDEVITKILDSEVLADVVGLVKISWVVGFAFFILTTIISVVIIVKMIMEWE